MMQEYKADVQIYFSYFSAEIKMWTWTQNVGMQEQQVLHSIEYTNRYLQLNSRSNCDFNKILDSS